MKNFIVFLCLITYTQVGIAQLDTVLTNQLQNVLNSSVSISGNNGVSAHLIMPDGQIWNGTAGLGYQNLPITDTTLFHGASTTKLNIATLIMLLVEDNLIDLDVSWNNYVSLDVEFDTLIAVRQLLNHTSGIADYLETASSGNDVTSDFNYFFTPQYILENIVSDVPDFPVGTGFQYSNSNYALAALIAETVTGNPVHTELRNRIWNPLGMDHTYFGAYETYTEPTAGVWWDFGSGLMDYSDVPTTSMLSYAYGAGNIVSCPTDLALLLKGVLNGQLLSTESLDEMLTFVPSSFNNWTAGYGLGIHHAFGQDDDIVIGHDGYYTNLTDMFHSTNCSFTLVTMTNTQTTWFGIFNPMYDILSNYCATSNIIEFENKTDLTIYPNPARDLITFDLQSNEPLDEVEIEIFDLLGQRAKKLSSQSFDNTLRETISLKELSVGMYTLKVSSDGKVVTHKFIKMK